MDCILSVVCSGGPGFIASPSVPDEVDYRWSNKDNRKPPISFYEDVRMFADDNGLIIYAHDDVTIHDSDWLKRVVLPFSDPDVIAVGLGGATTLGHHNLYKYPYQIGQMARGGYASNQTDWSTHGGHETGTRRVAVLDAFFMAVRASFLHDVGGWPVDHLTHHCLDLWLACEAARADKKIMMVGVSCTHHGGGTSTKPEYAAAKWLQGGSLATDHQEPHRWLYNKYRDVLPIQCSNLEQMEII